MPNNAVVRPGTSYARLPSRTEIRELAERHSRDLAEVADAGGNPHQTSLDQTDKVKLYADAMHPDDATVFIRMYAEELDAVTTHLNMQTARLLASPPMLLRPMGRLGNTVLTVIVAAMVVTAVLAGIYVGGL